ncbi:DNA polymerase theta-like [Diadema setosum]|uniref:DNA polymerase theta-like n=1 Tax=Diadema setosum TaxID=31175 RepID=UPI003B3AD337
MRKLTETWKQQKTTSARDRSFSKIFPSQQRSQAEDRKSQDGGPNVDGDSFGSSGSGGNRKRLGKHIFRHTPPAAVSVSPDEGPVQKAGEEKNREAQKNEKLHAPSRKLNHRTSLQPPMEKEHTPSGHMQNGEMVNRSFQSSFGGDLEFDDDVLLAVEQAEADFKKCQGEMACLREKILQSGAVAAGSLHWQNASRSVQTFRESDKENIEDGHHCSSVLSHQKSMQRERSKSTARQRGVVRGDGKAATNSGSTVRHQNHMAISKEDSSPHEQRSVAGARSFSGQERPVTSRSVTEKRHIEGNSPLVPATVITSQVPRNGPLAAECNGKNASNMSSNSKELLEPLTKVAKKPTTKSSVQSQSKRATQGMVRSIAIEEAPVSHKRESSGYLASFLDAETTESLIGAGPQGSKVTHVFCEDSQSQSEPVVIAQRCVSEAKPVTKKGRACDAETPRQCKGNSKGCDSRIPTRATTSALATPSHPVRHTRQRTPLQLPISPPPPTSPARDRLLLSSWGLPDPVLQQYHRAGITKMFPWQADCLGVGRVLEGGNLVYAAPTSAGKTLVAELLVLKKVLETKKKALIILPFVSVSREKMFYLQSMFSEAGVRVDGFMGSHSPPGGLASTDIAICTIEKANSLVNRLLEEKKIGQLGIVVVDELHMIGDSHRGYLLELLLTKLRYVVATSLQPAEQDGDKQSNPIQVVGMSATLPNLDLLAKWLEADLYRTEFRPVPLSEHVKIGKTLHDNAMARIREVEPRFEVKGDEDHIVTLCLETVSQGNGVLIFCPTKNWCEKLCETVAREIYRLHQGQLPTGNTGFTKASQMLPVKLDQRALRDVWEQLRRTPVSINPVLRKTVPYGVAYHHAGLTFDERDIIEGAFRQGFLKILVATSTLSSGVNLPARRVIIRSLMFNRKVIDPLTYKQMIGRAGRKGVDTEGESILVCKPSEREKASKLIRSQLPAVQSCLVKRSGDDLSNSLKRAILEVIASSVASSPSEVKAYASSTLLAASLAEGQATDDPESDLDTESAVLHCVKFLEENEFIRLQNVESGGQTKERYCPTQLGRATLASALSPDEALRVFAELQTARKNFVLENELHILYQVTPIYDQGFQPDWYQFVCSWESMSSDKRRVAELVGVEESFLMRASQGLVTSASRSAKVQKSIAVHRRFYTTLILAELVNEVPLPVVANRYNCATGQLQSLQQSASTFAGMVTVFCNRLGWWNLELLLAQFQSRLNFGVQRELCDLVRISLLNAQRARLLYDGGYQTVASLAASHPADVEMLLRNSVPFRSGRQAQGEAAYEALERQQTRCIWATGRKGLTEAEAAELIISEARHIVQAELGIEGVAWQGGEGTSGQQAEGSASVAGAKEMVYEDAESKDCRRNMKSEQGVDNAAKEPSRETGLECHKVTVESVLTTRDSTKESSGGVGRDATSDTTSPPSGRMQPEANIESRRTVLLSKGNRDTQSRHTGLGGESDGSCQGEKSEREGNEPAVKQVCSEDKDMKSEMLPVNGARHMTLEGQGVLNQTTKNQVLVTATIHPNPSARSSHSTGQPVRPVVKNALSTKKPDVIVKQTDNKVMCNSPPQSGTRTGTASADIMPAGASEHTIVTNERKSTRPSKETTPPSGQDWPREGNGSDGKKDTSPDLFSCPIEDEELVDAMHAITGKKKLGTSPQQEHATNQGLDVPGVGEKSSPSEAREDDRSPCFPSMDSQLEEFMAAYCTQNETVAQSASPDLTGSRKRIMPPTAGPNICNDRGRESTNASIKRDGGDDLSRNTHAMEILGRSREQGDVPTAESSHPDNQEVESTQDVLLAAAMCESFDSFSSSILCSPINTKRNHPRSPGNGEETSRTQVQVDHHAAVGMTLKQGSRNGQCNPKRIAAASGNANSDLSPPTLDDGDRLFAGAENKEKHHLVNCTKGTSARHLQDGDSNHAQESGCHRKSPSDAQLRSSLSKRAKSAGRAKHCESIPATPTTCRGGSERKNESSLLSPGTVAMLDFLAGDDDVDMFTQLKECPQGDAESCNTQVPAGRDLNVTVVANHHPAKKLEKRKKLPCSDSSSGLARAAARSNGVVSQGIVEDGNSSKETKSSGHTEKQGGKGEAYTHMKETRKESNVSRTSQTSKRKGRSDGISSPPKRQKTPPKDTLTCDKKDHNLINSRQPKDKSDSPSERKTSDSGDFIPPTPPKPTQGTPKLLRATGTTRRKSPRIRSKASSQHPKKPKASPSQPASATKYTSLRISPRRRQGSQESAAAKGTIQPRTNYHVPTSTAAPGKEMLNTHQSTGRADDAVKGGAVQTAPIPAVTPSMPCLESQMLHPECDDLFSQGTFDGRNDLNMAMDEFDLNLKLSVDSDVEMPSSPRAAPGLSPPPLLDSSSLPPPASSFTYPQSFSNTPSIPSSDGAFTIIDVCANVDLFHTFVAEWKRKKRYSVSVSCERYEPPAQQGGIGSNFKNPGASTKAVAALPDGFPIEDLGLLVTGIAVCWGGKDAYFISFQERIPEADPNDSLAQPTIAPGLPLRERLGQVRHVMEIGKIGRGARAQRQCKVVFGAKLQYKLLSRSCGCLLGGSLEDPKVAQWLIDPGSKEPNLQSLVTQYTPLETHLLEDLGGGVGLRGPGASPEMQGSGRLRATTEAVLGLCLMDAMKTQLEELSLWKTFEEVEMPSIVTLARVELNGIGVDGAECETQKAIMQAKLGSLEERAYQLAGHCFSLTSPEDIAQVLYTELKLPPNGDAAAAPLPGPARRTLGARGRPRLAKHFSTSKEALEKLRPLHPLPDVILEFRRISAAVAKVVFPLQKEKVPHERLKMDRVYTVYQTHTATGRVATFEPNIQAIPKEFDIHMPSVIEESPPGVGALPNRQYSGAAACMRRGKHGRMKGGAYTPVTGAGSLASKAPGPKFAVSIRQVFCPFPGGLMLAADYSQLELRLLAHLADDQALIAILNGGGDVFKQIAAKWRKADIGDVTPEQRQQAKQICYGMVYGIGAKALGEQLGVCEEDAAAFMESFKGQYKGMKNYLLNVVKQCKEKGYVQTLTGRRRYLPSINHANPGARSQAERQAVNTTVQGSAADLVKTAMVKIDCRLAVEFPDTQRSHRHRSDEQLGLVPNRRKSRRLQTAATTAAPSGAFLVLQLHDELIYEVRREDVHQVAQLIKAEMEGALALSVRLPVKVKVGPTWGTLEDMDL